MNKIPSHFILDLTCMVIFPIAFIFILDSLSFILIPFLIALLFCYAIGLPMDYLQQHHVPAVIRILLTVIFLFGICYILERLIQQNLISLVESWPRFEEKFWVYANIILARLDIPQEQAKETIKAFFSNIGKDELKPVGTMVQYLSGSFFSFLGNAFWVILFVVFILSERGAVTRKIVKGVGPEKQKTR